MAAALCTLFTLVRSLNAQAEPWRDVSRSPDERAAALVQAMSLEEKTALLYGAGTKVDGTQSWQVFVKGNARLGIPDVTQGDTASGILTGSNAVTQLPAPIALAATWSLDDATRYGDTLGAETRALGYGVLHGPNLDLSRDPRHGRVYDTFGEDPLLASSVGVAYIRAVQAHRVIADAKHFVANVIETDRRTLNLQIDQRSLRELYLTPFEAAVRDGHVGMVMCAYTQINGQPSCDREDLLTALLRREWGFRGIVRTDAGAAHSLHSLAAGVDQEFRGELHFGAELIEAVRTGSIDVSVVNAAVHRILRTMIEYGIFDGPPIRTGADLEAGRQAAQSVAEHAIVLLRNEGQILPLDPRRVASIAVIGPHAADTLTAGGPANRAPLGKESVVTAITNRLPNAHVMFSPGVDPIRSVSELFGFDLLPSSVLTTTTGQTGAAAQYVDAAGRVVSSQVDRCICFSTTNNFVDTVAAVQSVPSEFAAVTWTASLNVSRRGHYGLDVVTSGRTAITLDDRAVLVHARSTTVVRSDTFVTLSPGTHRLVVTYEPGPGAAQESTAAGPTHVLKVGWKPPDGVYEPSVEQAAAIAAAADVAIVVVRDLGSETLDRAKLSLPNGQERLIDAVARRNPQTVVVLMTGSAETMPWLKRVPAVVEAWYGGTAGTKALTRVLFGEVDASGRLPITFPARLRDLPTTRPDQFPGVGAVALASEGLRIGYRHYAGRSGPAPLFPFGFGLSYTHFTLRDLAVRLVESGTIGDRLRPALTVAFTVANTGRRRGVAVPQIYLRHPPTAGEPSPVLAGFARVDLEPGHSQRVTIPISGRSVSVYDTAGASWTVVPGTYTVILGASAADAASVREISIR